MEDEIILAFREDVIRDDPEMSYAKDLVMPLIDEIIRLKVKYEGMFEPDDKAAPEDDNPARL